MGAERLSKGKIAALMDADIFVPSMEPLAMDETRLREDADRSEELGRSVTMERKIGLWKKLKESAPLYYQISGRHYCIGSCVFGRCIQDQILVHEAFLEAVQAVKCRPDWSKEDDDVKRLMQLYGKIKVESQNRQRACYKRSAARESLGFFSALTAADVAAVQAQIEDYDWINRVLTKE